MIPFDKNTLELWLGSCDEFNYAFRRFCFFQFRAFSVTAEFVPNVINEAHRQWQEDCDTWLAHEAHPTTKSLSHLKIASLLLANLNTPFLGNMSEHEYNEESKVTVNLSPEQFRQARADLIDARESVLALDFCLAVIHWFEINRIDRKTPFHPTLTADMRHDLLSYLVTGKVDRKALYLILKALFNRANGGGAAN